MIWIMESMTVVAHAAIPGTGILCIFSACNSGRCALNGEIEEEEEKVEVERR